MGIDEWLCFHVAQWMSHRRSTDAVGSNAATFHRDDYQAWRNSGLRKQFDQYFTSKDVAARDVIDFGCGGGELSAHVATLGARSVAAMEVDASLANLARTRLYGMKLPCPVTVIRNVDTVHMDVPDASADVILCFDVLEHIMDYEQIFEEWRRVLRQQGRVLIWWVPWWNPYGPHIESLVPIPWSHVFFSERTLIRTCARVYDAPGFKPRLWDIDDNGSKKPNKWLRLNALPTVNKLSVRRFEQIIQVAGFHIDRREWHGFGGGRFSRMTRPLLNVPGIREGFMACTIYELRKSSNS